MFTLNLLHPGFIAHGRIFTHPGRPQLSSFLLPITAPTPERAAARCLSFMMAAISDQIFTRRANAGDLGFGIGFLQQDIGGGMDIFAPQDVPPNGISTWSSLTHR